MARELVADVEERMDVWVEEIGIWVMFQVMTMIAQVTELVAKAEEVEGSSDSGVLIARRDSRRSSWLPDHGWLLRLRRTSTSVRA